MTSNEKSVLKNQSGTINLISGLVSGVTSAGLFHAWDRALHLSFIYQRPFLYAGNFTTPFHGLTQTLMQRTVSSGLYFTLQKEISEQMYDPLRQQLLLSDSLAHICIGILAGATTGVFTHHLASIKYYIWAHPHHNVYSAISYMWQQGGVRAFMKGIYPNLLRNLIFGGIYEGTRTYISSRDQSSPVLSRNICAATAATLLTSPLNYVCTLCYNTPPTQRAPSIAHTLLFFWKQAQHHQSMSERFKFIQYQLRWNWGTLRVATQIGVGQKIFDETHQVLSQSSHFK